ncbi:site-specific recombinase [Rhodococcus opacus B4]|uniref:Site-specific recombinase n=1 Tax=Rhodococcus opacus (strain B4) TaxID=632772 RepID=C1B835_RHOOB|nr:site-specific recombinase [Rhodococcus opacus B4]
MYIGYARVSTDQQDLTAQQHALLALGVSPDRIYVDHGLTGTNRLRPGLQNALAACRNTDTLVVTKLDRLARSLPDARDIVDELTARHACLQIGASLHDPTDPVGRLLFNVLAMVAEFEGDLIRARTREGMRIAKAKGHLKGNRSSIRVRKGTSSSCTGQANTRPRNWPICSRWAGRRCTGRSNAPAELIATATRKPVPSDSRTLGTSAGPATLAGVPHTEMRTRKSAP